MRGNTRGTGERHDGVGEESGRRETREKMMTSSASASSSDFFCRNACARSAAPSSYCSIPRSPRSRRSARSVRILRSSGHPSSSRAIAQRRFDALGPPLVAASRGRRPPRPAPAAARPSRWSCSRRAYASSSSMGLVGARSRVGRPMPLRTAASAAWSARAVRWSTSSRRIRPPPPPRAAAEPRGAPSSASFAARSFVAPPPVASSSAASSSATPIPKLQAVVLDGICKSIR